MATLINNWFKQIFTHHALNQSYHTDINSAPGQHIDIDRNCLLGEIMTARCTIVDKPSTMFDADAMHCDDEQNENRNILLNNPTEIQSTKKDTIVIDKFQTCFIDCTCQCEVKIYTCRKNEICIYIF